MSPQRETGEKRGRKGGEERDGRDGRRCTVERTHAGTHPARPPSIPLVHAPRLDRRITAASHEEAFLLIRRAAQRKGGEKKRGEERDQERGEGKGGEEEGVCEHVRVGVWACGRVGVWVGGWEGGRWGTHQHVTPSLWPGKHWMHRPSPPPTS